MRKKKLFFLILICILFFPFVVNAEECDISKITVMSMEENGIGGHAEEVGAPVFKDRSIDFNLKMYEVGDSITYDMTIKNDSNEDYMISEDTFKTDSEYIEYTLKTHDGNNVVKAKNSKDLTLIIAYKKEIDDSLLNNNKFDASNSLTLSLNTSDKEKELNSITTNNIKNPSTSRSNIYLICFLLFIFTIAIYFNLHNKKKYNIYLILILCMVFIPVGYAICKCDIEVESSIEIEKLPSFYDTFEDLADDNSCIIKYDNEVTDQVGITKRSDNVYFNTCPEKRNVIFGNLCWQIIRTTDTKGTKVVYNGEPVNGKCLKNNNFHKGINGNSIEQTDLNSEYLYGSSFTYDLSNNTFTLTDTKLATWNDSTYESIIGKYTCKSTNATCSTIYSINDYIDNNTAYTISYTIGNTNPALIGESPFNANRKTASAVGYMYNKTYNIKERQIVDETFKYGSDVTYDSSTHMYTLSGNVKNIAPSYYKGDVHYTCWNTSGECSEVSFMYRFETGNKIYYINLKNGKKIDDAINDMLNNDNLNVYDSSIKGIIDAWYKQNLIKYQSRIEDTVYCNSREINSLGTWRIDKDIDIFYGISFRFNTLTCKNITDSFSISNNKAKLKYPVGLISNEEWENLNDIDLRRIGTAYWTISPNDFYTYDANNRYIYADGFTSINYTELTSVSSIGGIRPAISLSQDSLVSSGDGSENNPWIIK